MRQVYCSTRSPVNVVMLAFEEDPRLDVNMLDVEVKYYMLHLFKEHHD